MVHNENSLSFQVFKARYFLAKDPYEVEISPKSSFIWRSLLKGREIVERGAVCRVGDGNSIQVWKKKLIPRLPTGCPSLHGLQRPTPMMVSKLIDADRRVWHTEMVSEIFQAEEASKILSNIPLSKQPVPDKLI